MKKDEQLILIKEEIPNVEYKPIRILYCKFHRWANETDFVEITIKKTGEKIKRCHHCEREKAENKKIRSTDWQKEKDNVTDYYVRRTLAIGKNTLPMNEYPDDLVKAKQAVIKLKRALKKENEPIKKCSKHGNLYRNDIILSGKDKSGTQKYRCKACMKELHSKHYELNKKKVLIAQQLYKKNNPENYKEIRKKSFQKNRHKYLARDNERIKLYDRKCTVELKDRYIKKYLVKRTNLSMSDISPELIDCVRAIQRLKRGTKEVMKSNRIIEIEDELNGKN